MHLADRLRARIREEMAARAIQQRDVAGITGWSQSKVAKILQNQMVLTVDILEGFAFALNLSPVELVRDRGYEFCAELTPTELRILQVMRDRPTDAAAIQQLLRAADKNPGSRPSRRLLPSVGGATQRRLADHAQGVDTQPTTAAASHLRRQAPGAPDPVAKRRTGPRSPRR